MGEPLSSRSVVSVTIVTWRPGRVFQLVDGERWGRLLGSPGPNSASGHRYPRSSGGFAAATLFQFRAFIAEKGPGFSVTPSETLGLCSRRGWSPSCGASRLVSQTRVPAQKAGVGFAGRRALSLGPPRPCAGEPVHRLRKWGGEASLFLLARAAVSCNRVEKFISVGMFF